MARRFRLKMSRIFQSCQSKDTSDINPTNHVHPPTTFKPPHKHHHNTMKRHISAALVGCGLKAQTKPTASDDDDHHFYSSIGTPKFQWDKEAKWHVVEMTPPHDSTMLDVVPPAPPPTAEKKTRKKRRVKKRKGGVSRIRVSTSSADSVIFSSEGFIDGEDEETENLVSSKSFSTDTSMEFNLRNMTITEMPANMRRKKKNVKSRVKPRRSFSSVGMICRSPPEMESPARLSVFQRMIPCTVEGKMRESFAVVKKSEDPYEDFKKSMMEMILEKKMFDEKDLEQLLHCFLSLNSKDHHAVIVKAFSEIWEALFSRRSCSFKVSAAL